MYLEGNLQTFQCSPRCCHMILPLWSHFLLLFLAYSWSCLLFFEGSTYASTHTVIFCFRGALAYRGPHSVSLCARPWFNCELFQAKLRLRLAPQAVVLGGGDQWEAFSLKGWSVPPRCIDWCFPGRIAKPSCSLAAFSLTNALTCPCLPCIERHKGAKQMWPPFELELKSL